VIAGRAEAGRGIVFEWRKVGHCVLFDLLQLVLYFARQHLKYVLRREYFLSEYREQLLLTCDDSMQNDFTNLGLNELLLLLVQLVFIEKV